MKINRLYCHKCNKYTKCSSEGSSHLLHLFLSAFTFGIWLIIWPFVSSSSNQKWNCDVCGTSILISEVRKERWRKLGRDIYRMIKNTIKILIFLFVLSLALILFVLIFG